MPKVPADPVLQEELQAFVDSSMSLRGAAEQLGVGAPMLSRFLKSGRSTPANCMAMRNKLVQLRDENATDFALFGVGRRAMPPLKVQDLHQIKRFCEGVLALVAVYEGRLVARLEAEAGTAG